MTPSASDALRRAAAHVLVADVSSPALDEPATHHLFRVLRVRDGEIVTITDGAGSWRACRARGRTIEPIADVEFLARRDEPITVAFAVPKQDRPEWVVQKLTELGVDRIRVLHAARSVVRWSSERADRHLGKLRRVAAEAVQQSRGVWLPVIDGPIDASDVLGEMVVAEPGGRTLLPVDRNLAIGPEGGWSPDELERASDRVSLGSTVLRVETAAIVGAARLIAHGE